MNVLKRYFKGDFVSDLNSFMPSQSTPNFGDRWGEDFHGLSRIPIDRRSNFLATLFMLVLTDELIHSVGEMSSVWPTISSYDYFQSTVRAYLWSCRFDKAAYPLKERAALPRFVRNGGRVNPHVYHILTGPLMHGLCDRGTLQATVLGVMPFFVRFLRFLGRQASASDSLLERLWADPHFSSPVRHIQSEGKEPLPLLIFHHFQKELEHANLLGAFAQRRYIHLQRKRMEEDAKTPMPFTAPVTGKLASLIEYASSDDRISPSDWTRLYNMLPLGMSITGAPLKPDLPLILGGWLASDYKKRERVAYHIRWAAEYGVLVRVDTYLRSLRNQDWCKSESGYNGA